MRLSKIKIAGFKSFVDPTTIALPSNRVAVVGPNGCGKSNIIDAVTWVMGESSPKYLRGESLTDVIFNGSNARKPIGQASVELIFDNSDTTIGGEYASFAEISVKRMINRDSDSSYYLNGVRCRKRDIVDIFLGTGLGPRSYSIIGQNMISRVIEAKPDELRTYLEEAAGISKYKERRHETELRIHHTKENLARVNDLRGELDKQLGHLKHQANVAEKFKVLKQQERTLRAELYAIQWRQLDSKMVDHTLQIQREETALEARMSDLSGTDREIEQMRHEQRVAHDAFQEIQRRYYAVGNEITRIEQDILHHQEREKQWQNDLNQTEIEYQAVKNQIAEAEDQNVELERDLETLDPQLSTAKRELSILEEQFADAEDEMQTWQNNWDEFNQTSAATNQKAQVEKNNISHLEQKIHSLQNQHDRLAQDQSRFNFTELSKEIEEYSKKSYEMADKIDFHQNELNEIRNSIKTLQLTQQDSTTHLDNVRSELQKLRGQQASLEALQQTALGQRDNPAAPWIADCNLAEKPRLAQHIEVEKGWEQSVEKVLGFCLQAICVDQFDDVVTRLNDLKSGNVCLFTKNQSTAQGTHQKGELLIDKIKSSLPLQSLLSGIYVADSLSDAMKLCESLSADESVVTKDGVWANPSWLKILRVENPAAGVFEREQELKSLASRIEKLQETQAELEKNIAARKDKLISLETSRDQLQQAYNQHQAQSAQINAEQKMKQQRMDELQSQSVRFMKDMDDCSSQLKQAQADLEQSKTSWEEALSELDSFAKQRDELIRERDQVKQQLQHVREHVTNKQQKVHELEIQLQTSKSQKSAMLQSVERMQKQLSSLNDRKAMLQGELASMPPLDSLNKSLSRALDKHVTVESELNTARVAVESLDQEYRNLEERRQAIDRDMIKVRGSLEKLRVELQGWKVKADTLCEQIKETEFTLEDTLKQLTEEVSVDEWQTKLDQVVNRINRLGPINLVAIDEYATCQERKVYLDKQLEDLQQGLNTLEEAIAKIDKETRTKFKDTFDRVNERFQELFPTVFGGGKAYLELNSDNLLEAGVTMMACPPGKRNSSIYLLSGGEKSLTAIALIFSIFHLNPAPFCLLDEVDAALDDANVMRFTRLVKAMADKTQFIFISHNKITIEMGEHLIGVTMNEPGVSRLVSVDIEKAISLAGA